MRDSRSFQADAAPAHTRAYMRIKHLSGTLDDRRSNHISEQNPAPVLSSLPSTNNQLSLILLFSADTNLRPRRSSN